MILYKSHILQRLAYMVASVAIWMVGKYPANVVVVTRFT